MPSLKLKDNVRAELVAYLASLRGESYRQNPPWNSPSLRTDPVKRGETHLQPIAGCVRVSWRFEVKGGFPNNNVVGNKIPSLTDGPGTRLPKKSSSTESGWVEHRFPRIPPCRPL
jgi:hypothetical protein